MAHISGPYAWSYNSFTLGVMNDAPRLRFSNSVDTIVGDNLGDTIQDGVFRGHNLYVDLILNEFNAAAAQEAFWPYANTFGRIGQVGDRLLTYAKRLEATAIDPTIVVPTYLRMERAILAPGFEMSLLYGSRHRNVPLQLLCLPFVESGVTYLYNSIAVS